MADHPTASPEPQGEGASATNDARTPEQLLDDWALSGRTSPARPAAPGTEGDVRAAPSVGDAEAAWAAVIQALIERHKDGVPAWFGTYRLASLSGSTLTVYLADFEVRTPYFKQRGRAADLTITGYAKELAYLWRGISGDGNAVLELRGDSPKGGPAR